MSESMKKPNQTPESYSPVKPEILCEIEEKQKTVLPIKPFVRFNTVTLITLDEEIKVVGLSYEKCRQTGSVALGSKFDLYSGDKITLQENVINVKQPEIKRAVWANGDLLFGKEVTDINGQDEIYASITIPTGRYLKVSWNAENFDELVMEAMEKSWERAGAAAFLEENGLCIAGMGIETYPQDKVYGSETNYPEMYTLHAVKDKE
ncbi:MAG: hypothetical protein A2Y17_04925 [Clostridiales bacterium GWF2_38_85]|nr:MAG: hypothetical protein A2Y17_04925 [Clostridiales bacterium GWF2_38_85]HBL84369.1 hypothetical protein [Clostridiales bacterium]